MFIHRFYGNKKSKCPFHLLSLGCRARQAQSPLSGIILFSHFMNRSVRPLVALCFKRYITLYHISLTVAQDALNRAKRSVAFRSYPQADVVAFKKMGI